MARAPNLRAPRPDCRDRARRNGPREYAALAPSARNRSRVRIRRAPARRRAPDRLQCLCAVRPWLASADLIADLARLERAGWLLPPPPVGGGRVGGRGGK